MTVPDPAVGSTTGIRPCATSPSANSTSVAGDTFPASAFSCAPTKSFRALMMGVAMVKAFAALAHTLARAGTGR